MLWYIRKERDGYDKHKHRQLHCCASERKGTDPGAAGRKTLPVSDAAASLNFASNVYRIPCTWRGQYPFPRFLLLLHPRIPMDAGVFFFPRQTIPFAKFQHFVYIINSFMLIYRHFLNYFTTFYRFQIDIYCNFMYNQSR